METRLKASKQARIYGRFSSKPQEKGDSIRRQIEGARAYAKNNNITIIGEPYFDAGVSGKAGLNLEKEFVRYLREAQTGEILLVEITDRIGRQNPFVLSNLIYQTVQKGIEIHFWAENKIVNADNIEELATQFNIFTGAAVGHQENRRKTFRIKETVEQTIAESSKGNITRGVIRFTPQCFFWDETKNAIAIKPESAAIIKRIFEEYNKGNGTTSIAKMFNEEGTLTFYGKKVWYGNNVKVILTNDCYNGILNLNGHKFDILPKIVSDEVWQKTQMLVVRNRGKRGKFSGRANNLFEGISFCKNCGGRIKNAVTNRKYKYYSYCCKPSTFGGCKDDNGILHRNVMLNARQVEYGFFKTFFGKGAHSLVKDGNRNIELKEQIEVCKAKLEALGKAIGNLYDLVEQGDKEATRRIAQRQTDKDKVQDEIKILQAQLTEDGEFESQVATIYNMVTMEDIWVSKKQLVPINDIIANNDNRKKITMILPTLLSKITFDCPSNCIEVFRKDGKSLGSYCLRDFKDEIKNSFATKNNSTPVNEFEPPKRTFAPRLLLKQKVVQTPANRVKEYLAKTAAKTP
jgi:DNA invertase Pin-like site-specific DNA recombinase